MSPSKNLFSLVLSSLLLAGCASAPEYPPGAPQRVVFFDSESFDQQVRGVVDARSERVEIPMLAPASINSLPPRLSKVLGNVQSAGGKVTVQGPPAADGAMPTKGLNLLGLIPALYDAVVDLQQRQAFKGYDANVEVVEGKVTRVLLTKTR